MWYPATITTPATAEPVTLAEAKQHAHVDSTYDDGELVILIASARDHVERYCNARLMTQTMTAKCDGFCDMARLPAAPVQSVTSITYVDTAGAPQALSTDVYELRADELEASIVLNYGQSWPPIQSGSRITMTAVVGYEEVPPAVKQGLLLFISDSYEQRENAKAEDWTALDSLLCNFRRGA